MSIFNKNVVIVCKESELPFLNKILLSSGYIWNDTKLKKLYTYEYKKELLWSEFKEMCDELKDELYVYVWKGDYKISFSDPENFNEKLKWKTKMNVEEFCFQVESKKFKLL